MAQGRLFAGFRGFELCGVGGFGLYHEALRAEGSRSDVVGRKAFIKPMTRSRQITADLIRIRRAKRSRRQPAKNKRKQMSNQVITSILKRKGRDGK